MKNFTKIAFGILMVFIGISGQQLFAQASAEYVSVQPQKGFIMTGINNGIYSVNANTGTLKLITYSSFSSHFANSLNIDTIRGNIYYTQNCDDTVTYAIYGFNYRTNTHFTLTTDFRTAIGAPIVAHGMGTGGGCFYNGEIYIGSEAARAIPGGPTYQSGGKTFNPFSNIIHKITLNATGTAIINTSVFKDYFNDNAEIYYWAADESKNGTYASDWGDFTVINDTLFERVGNDASARTSNAYLMSAPANRIYHLQTSTDGAISFTQVADDGYKNLIYMSDPVGNQQRLVYGNKTNGTYNTTTAIPMTLGGVAYTAQIADATSVYKGEGVIGNTVWHDTNANGVKDIGEFGIANAPIELWEDLDSNNVINITTDKLVGTALTNNAGHYGFLQVLPGNYMLRAVTTTSVNYPAQSFSASYPFNQLAGAGIFVSDAGDETVTGSSTTNSLARNFSTINFDDQTADFGFTGSFTVLANNDLTLKTNYANGSVILNWTFTRSNNEKNYFIEKSVDGVNFSTIENGPLTNSSINKTSIDNNLPANIFTIYYRIKIIDNVGQVKYSNIEKVNIIKSKNEGIIVFPNPAKENVTFLLSSTLANKKVCVNITNSAGQIVKKLWIKTTNTKLTINLTNLKSGTYFWSIFINDAKNIFSQGKLQVL